MEINSTMLLFYALVWTIFYWFLSQFIAQLSRDKWVEYVKSEESDDVLVEALQAVIEEIENRVHDKLQNFQDTFFGSVGAMTKRAKELDPMNGIRKAAKDGDWTSMLVEYAANKAGIGGVLGNLSGEKSPKEPKSTPKVAIPKGIKDIFKL